jgi:hypothetical protein
MGNQPWHERPTFLVLLELAKFRRQLRRNSLHDTSQLPDRTRLPQPQPRMDERHPQFDS